MRESSVGIRESSVGMREDAWSCAEMREDLWEFCVEFKVVLRTVSRRRFFFGSGWDRLGGGVCTTI
jgi:hypothetical protein